MRPAIRGHARFLRPAFLLPAAAIVLAAWVMAGSGSAPAQPQLCTPHRVQASLVDVSMESRLDSLLIDVLKGDEIACISREQAIGGRQWGYVAFKASAPGERKVVDGWVLMQHLKPIPRRQFDKADHWPPFAKSNSAEEAVNELSVRFDQPVPFGPVPVNGRTLRELSDMRPMFPPLREADQGVLEKNCSGCHKWDRENLCKQGGVYLLDPKSALRHPHPFGGAFKVALMRWSKAGCH